MNNRSPEGGLRRPVEHAPRGLDAKAATEEGASARRTLIRVIVVQVVALGLLWLLQARYHI